MVGLVDEQELAMSLGLSRQNLPKSIGGEWSYDTKFEEWQDLQIRKEWGLPLGNMYSDEACGKSNANLGLSQKERQERKRRYNVLHSRRKRMKQKFEVEAMEEKVKELKDENRFLLRNQQELLVLMEKAKAHIPQQSHTTDNGQLQSSSPQFTGTFSIPMAPIVQGNNSAVSVKPVLADFSSPTNAQLLLAGTSSFHPTSVLRMMSASSAYIPESFQYHPREYTKAPDSGFY